MLGVVVITTKLEISSHEFYARKQALCYIITEINGNYDVRASCAKLIAHKLQVEDVKLA
jgi:hypothetical protein